MTMNSYHMWEEIAMPTKYADFIQPKFLFWSPLSFILVFLNQRLYLIDIYYVFLSS